jgi:hypothetical protein
MSRKDLTACKADLACPSEAHLLECPWHPYNVESVTVPADAFDDFLRELDREPKELPRLTELMQEGLLPAEEAEVTKILGMMDRGALIDGYVSSLFMRYNFNRWQMIINEVVRRVKESQSR